MSVTAQAGIIGFGPQKAKCETWPDNIATRYFRHRATMVDLDVADDVREGPPEVGGIAVPTFPYKAGPVVAGGFTIQPRLEDTLGWLLYALMGKHSQAGGYNYEYEYEYDYAHEIYTHAFTLASDSGQVPWMTIRKYIPKKDGGTGTDLGQQFEDCKLVGATLTLPNDGPIAMRVDAIGRHFTLVDSPLDESTGPAWAWENTMESWESIPIACETLGEISIAGAPTLHVVAAQVGWQNVPLDLRQERVYGDPYLEDVTIIQRRLTFDLTVKYTDPELYRLVLGGNVAATGWSGHPFTGALNIKTVASTPMENQSEANPYELDIDAPEVMLTQVGGITLAGNQAIMMRFAGVALDASNSGEYATFTLTNEIYDYVWPS
jgi:hypothetical protein